MAAPMVELIVKWAGNEYKITCPSDAETVGDFKKAIQKETGVLPERQKLLGLKYKGKVPDDDVRLSSLKMKPGSKVMMMGTREDVIQSVIEPPEDLPEVVNDFDIEEEEVAIKDREEYLTKVERRVRDFKVEIINEPREGKKLLVLDIDYTLFDHKSTAETGTELMRPFLHEFLTSAYEDYDIVIWSATSMKWIKAKMEELGVSSHGGYKLCFMLDSLAMITVDTPSYGVIETKPLGVIWGKYSQWSPANTIMFDDLRRNFIMNPQSGLKIRPFRDAHRNRQTDKELLRLSKYLKDISHLTDFSQLNHRKWERFKLKSKKSGSKEQDEHSPSTAGDAS